MGTIIAPARADMPTPDRLLQQFWQIAFFSEEEGYGRAGRLIKWEGPILARIYGENVRQYVPEVQAHLNDLSRLSGLSITILNDLTTPSNLDIWFRTEEEMRRNRPDGLCSARVESINFRIVQAQVNISREIPEKRRHCLVEELSQSMGLLNDSSLFRTSIFNDHNRIIRLAPWDEQMIYMLYDPRLQPGMTLDQALPTMKSIVNGFAARNPF